MGILRLILALSVVCGHGVFYSSFIFINAGAAVICFFIISGFYMALVIDKKYYSQKSLFFFNRFLRLYPSYWCICFIIIMVKYIHHAPIMPNLESPWKYIAIIPMIVIIGQDWLQIAMEGFHFSKYASIVPIPSWSIAVELVLYGLAAFCFKRPKGIIGLFCAGFILRAFLQYAGFINPPWGNKALPDVLVFFAAGGMAYLVYKRISEWRLHSRISTISALLLCLGVYLFQYDGLWQFDSGSSDWHFIPLYILIAGITPFLFSLSKQNRIDRFIGDLSYPIYLIHIFLFWYAEQFIPKDMQRLFVLLTALVSAALIVVFIEYPIDRWRQKRSEIKLPWDKTALTPAVALQQFYPNPATVSSTTKSHY